MTNRQNAAREAAKRSYAKLERLPDEAWLEPKRTHASMVADQMIANVRAGNTVYLHSPYAKVSLDTPLVPIAEMTADPYAAEGVKLAREDRIRRAAAFANGEPAAYFNWRQSIGNDYYDEQDRLAGRVAASGRVAANDNVRAGRAVA